jgi:hypothetical protein
MTERFKGFLIAFVVGVLITAMAVIYHQRDKLKLRDFSPPPAPAKSKNGRAS